MQWTECPHCHAAMPQIVVTEQEDTHRSKQIRRGLLYVLLAAVIHYFAAGYSALPVPYPILPIVTVVLSPLLFLGGLGLVLHGYLLSRKSLSHSVRYR
jgi:ABC-type thiamin/hydroxymethylpyrimidine transport system permease subunit